MCRAVRRSALVVVLVLLARVTGYRRGRVSSRCYLIAPCMRQWSYSLYCNGFSLNLMLSLIIAQICQFAE